MQTLIVPIDFSEISINAAIYAAHFSQEIDATQMVLFHTTIGTDQSEQSLEVITDTATLSMQQLAEQIKVITPNLEIKIDINNDYLIAGIETINNQYKNALVIMGITGKNFIEQKLIGSNTLKVVKTKGIPVLIIPKNCEYTPIRNIGLAIQYRNIDTKKISVDYITDLCNRLNAHLSIINIDNASTDQFSMTLKERHHYFTTLFNPLDLSCHYMKDVSVTQGLHSFIHQMNIDLIIALTEETSFLKNIYKQGLAQSLPFVVNKPILIMKS